MLKRVGAMLGALVTAALVAGAAQAQDKPTIALIPGLTTDAFYITMRKGAQHAADALGVELIFQGGPDFNPTVQVPVLNAVTARQPDAILIAPTDKQQLIGPLKQAADAGIQVITVDTFIDDGQYQDGRGEGDFPLSYIASDNVLGGFMAGAALGAAIERAGQGLRLQRQARHLDHRPARGGLQARHARALPGHRGARDPVQRRRRQQGVLAAAGGARAQSGSAGVFGANLFSAIGAADGVKAAGKSGEVKVVAFDAPQRIVDDIKSGLIDLAIAQHPAEIGYYGVMTAYAALTGQSVPTTIGTGFTVMDADNIDDPEIQKFVYSD